MYEDAWLQQSCREEQTHDGPMACQHCESILMSIACEERKALQTLSWVYSEAALLLSHEHRS